MTGPLPVDVIGGSAAAGSAPAIGVRTNDPSKRAAIVTTRAMAFIGLPPGRHGWGVIGDYLGADLAKQYVGLVGVVALIIEGLRSVGDRDGDRDPLRRQIRLNGSFPGEQGILHQPLAGTHDPETIGVSIALLEARRA